MIKWNRADTDCKNERTIFSCWVSFTDTLGLNLKDRVNCQQNLTKASSHGAKYSKLGVKNLNFFWNFTKKHGQDFQVPVAGAHHSHMLLFPSRSIRQETADQIAATLKSCFSSL